MTPRVPNPRYAPTPRDREIDRQISKLTAPPKFTPATLPDPARSERETLFVNTGAALRPAYCDGTEWRWFSDDTIVS